MPKPIQLTENERAELTASCISMLARLRKDKHVHIETIRLWESMCDKLIRAKD
jgi:hypothetical protein